ncbi:flagellar motor protein MotB [Lichenibacterium dinghuense]|uniref:flagellar motor protein MotB n=1 Tax=Lichenibacterium dinghuense TaxID=2895977 RepID=UPI001F431FDE|nr:flagellar motor protein MotB [Lichenibacterium sp. 6Y81]
MSDESHPHEIIIIKRHGGGHDDGHHGGAWKIAYADFVTAMMAFFLVMWLLSANDKTKAAIVKYFNPIQLVDSTPQPPGLGDPSDKATPDPKKTGAKAPEKASPEPADKAKPGKDEKKEEEGKRDEPKKDDVRKDDAALFKDPYAVLGEIAAKDASPAARTGVKAPPEGAKGGAGPAAAVEGRGGEAFRDPFDPSSMRPAGAVDGAAESGRTEPTLPSTVPSAPAPAAAALADPAEAPLPAAPAAKAAELKGRIDALMKSVAAAAPGPEPRVEVRQTAEGVLIGLTDDAKFSMFASASAEPSPRTVTLMEKIGRLLKAQKGRVVLRGYTDARKYRSDVYDNWRLSSARADMARYMLVRGGVDDARFERIEGYADRQPRNAKDPDAPENRRIEILLREAP